MSLNTDYRIRQAGRRWLLCYQGRLVGIYFAECDAIRGQVDHSHLNCNRSTKAMKITILYKREHAFVVDESIREDLIAHLKDDGVTGKPDNVELLTALQNMVSENPDELIPTAEDLAQDMELVRVDDNDLEIEEDAE